MAELPQHARSTRRDFLRTAGLAAGDFGDEINRKFTNKNRVSERSQHVAADNDIERQQSA